MAQIGDILFSPESGWKRYDQDNENISYKGNWETKNWGSRYNTYGDSVKQSYDEGDTIKFNFTGTSLLLRCYSNYDTSGFNLKIDGKDKGDIKTCLSKTDNTVVYLSESLENKEHYVEIKVLSTDNFEDSDKTRVALDSIDILEEEELKPYNPIFLKYLFNYNNDIKTYNNGWNTLCQSGNETESDFLNNGISDLNKIPQEELKNLGNATILTYTDDTSKKEVNTNITGDINNLTKLESSQPKLLTYTDDLENTRQSNIEAIPNGQLILPNSDINLSDVDNIDDITLTANQSNQGILKLIVSKDSGTTWQTLDNGSFVDINASEDIVKTDGMNVDIFNNITSTEWNSYIDESETLRIGYYLELTTLDDTAETDKLDMQIDLMGSWTKAVKDTDYDYTYDDSNTITVEIMKDGSYKINYQK